MCRFKIQQVFEPAVLCNSAIVTGHGCTSTAAPQCARVHDSAAAGFISDTKRTAVASLTVASASARIDTGPLGHSAITALPNLAARAGRQAQSIGRQYPPPLLQEAAFPSPVFSPKVARLPVDLRRPLAAPAKVDCIAGEHFLLCPSPSPRLYGPHLELQKLH